MKRMIMYRKIAFLVMAFVFLNATVSYSYGCIEDMQGLISNTDPNYAKLIDYLEPTVDEKFNINEGLIFVTDDDIYFAFPSYEDLSVLIMNESTGESKVISADDLVIEPNQLCDFLVFCVLFTFFIWFGSSFLPCLITHLLFC